MTATAAKPAETTDLAAIACRMLEDYFPTGDEASAVAACTSDFVNHEAPVGVPNGPSSLVHFMRMLRAGFSDQKWTIHRTVTEGDTVVLHCTHSGRHTGPIFGMPASGRSFAYEQVHIVRMENGLAAEQWGVRDDATLMRQLSGVAGGR